jgi:hypothetical protein
VNALLLSLLCWLHILLDVGVHAEQ